MPLTEKIRDWELPSFLTTDNVADTTDITQTVVSDTTYSPVAKPYFFKAGYKISPA